MEDVPARQDSRLKEYDYSQDGAYFVTICVQDMHEILWGTAFTETRDRESSPSVGARIARPSLSDIGRIVETAINNISRIYETVTVDKYVIMPNHLHIIMVIGEDGRAMRAPTISTVINQMKGFVTKQVGYSIWQKLFYDHVIRDTADYLRIWQYIDENPAKWGEDEYHIE